MCSGGVLHADDLALHTPSLRPYRIESLVHHCRFGEIDLPAAEFDDLFWICDDQYVQAREVPLEDGPILIRPFCQNLRRERFCFQQPLHVTSNCTSATIDDLFLAKLANINSRSDAQQCCVSFVRDFAKHKGGKQVLAWTADAKPQLQPVFKKPSALTL